MSNFRDYLLGEVFGDFLYVTTIKFILIDFEYTQKLVKWLSVTWKLNKKTIFH